MSLHLKKLASIALARSTAIIVGLIFLMASIGSIGLFIADTIEADPRSHDGSSDPSWYPSNSIGLGTSSESDFEGLQYFTLPTLRLCPRTDGRWDGSIEWSGSVRRNDPNPTTSGDQEISTQGLMSSGQVILALPQQTTDIRRADVKFDLVSQYSDGMAGISPTGGRHGTPPTITEAYNHKFVSFNPFDGAAVAVDDRRFASGKITFVLPPLKTRTNGFGDWEFHLPLTNQTFDKMSAGLGKATPDTEINLAEEYFSDLQSDGKNPPRLAIVLCKNDTEYTLGEFSPEPRSSSDEYKWISTLARMGHVSGRVSGGALHAMADSSLGFSGAIMGALLGALYGVALTKRNQAPAPSPQASTRNKAPSRQPQGTPGRKHKVKGKRNRRR